MTALRGGLAVSAAALGFATVPLLAPMVGGAQSEPCPVFERGMRVRTLAPMRMSGSHRDELEVVAVTGDVVAVHGDTLYVNGLAQDDAIHHRNQSAPASWDVVVEPCVVVFVAGKENLDTFSRNYGLYPASMLEPLEDPVDDGAALSVLDEARIREAIAFGEEHPRNRLNRHLTLMAKRVPTDEHRWMVGTVSTPFTRVAMAAHRARQGAVRLKRADVQKEWLEPKLHVYVCPRVYEGLPSAPVRVFIRPTQGSLEEKVRATVPAERLAPMPPAYHRLFFDHYQVTVGHGLMAVFPLSALTADSEVYVEYLEQRPLCSACGATLPPQPGPDLH